MKSMRSAVEDFLQPSVGHRFMTTFLFHTPTKLGPISVKVPSPLDVSFQSISGLGSEIKGTELREGGDNTSQYFLPNHVVRKNLVLTRGVMKKTPVSLAFDLAMNKFMPLYFDVFVLLLNEHHLPMCYWTVCDAQPVKWEPAPLDAMKSEVLINTIELSYREIAWGGVRR